VPEEIDAPLGLDSIPLELTGTGTVLDRPLPERRDRWQFLTGPASGGYDQELTAATGRKLTVRLTTPSEAAFGLDGRLPQATNVEEMVTDVHVLWTSKLSVTHRLFRGRVGPTSDTVTEDAHTMTVNALDYRAVVARRHLLEGDAKNLNAGFQDGTGFWSGTGGTLEVDDTQAQVGKRSGRITPDGVTATVLITADDFATGPGIAYRLTGWARCSVAKTVTYTVTWKNAAHTLISTNAITIDLDAEAWTRLELDATSPPLTAYAAITLSMTGTPAVTDLLWLDEGRLSTTPHQQSRLRFDQVDQAEIAWQLIQDTQARVSGNLGISPAWSGSAPTGELRDRQYELGDSIGDKIQQLSEVIDGFDWDILPISASGLQLQVWHPQRGANRGVVLELGGLITGFSRQVSPSDYANCIRQTGADNLDAQEREADDLATQPAGRWDGIYADTGLTTQVAVNERAGWQMQESQFIQPTWASVALAAESWLGPDHIWVGDLVRLVVYSGRLQVDTILRVFEMVFDIADDGSVSILLTLGGRAPDLRRFRSLVERRLTTLERR
jgi:hypothetical protein